MKKRKCRQDKQQLPLVCSRCGCKRVDIGGYGNRICPANCDSLYMLHNQEVTND